MTQFAAGAVAVEELPDYDCFLVALADDPADPSYTWEMQVRLAYDDQDRSLGQDTYSLTRDGAATVYGGVLDCRLRDGVLTLLLGDQAARDLSVDQTVRFVVDADPAALQRLREGLRRVFAPAMPQAPHLDLD